MEPDTSFRLENKTIWIAGETGLVGQALIRRLQHEKCTVLSSPHNTLDLTRQKETEEWIDANRPDAIILAAATVGGIGANAARPADFLYDNLSIAQNVIHAGQRAGTRKLLYLGSSCIYPKHALQPIPEKALLTGPLEETNQWYAIAKIAGVKLCQAMRKQYGCDFITAMPCNLYGPGDRFDEETSHVIPALMQKMYRARQNNSPSVTLWGTGKALREFLYIDDLANALLILLQNYSGETPVNIGSSTEISITELAHMIRDITGYTGDLTFDSSRPDGTPRKILDNRRIHALGWTPQVPLQEGLIRTWEWFHETRETRTAA